MKRNIAALVMMIAAVLLVCSCGTGRPGGDTETDSAISGKTFVWEKEGFGGDFTISFFENGEYQYYEGFLSSYIGYGTWTEKEGTVTLTDKTGYDMVFNFVLKDGDLSFVADGSSSFIYTEVEDGDRFTLTSASAEDSSVSLTVPEQDGHYDDMPVLVIRAGDKVFYASFDDNSSSRAFIEKLSQEMITLDMEDYGGFEKVGDLPWDLPRNDERITTSPGDIILYLGNRITIYYDENTWDFTRIAQIWNTSKDELLEALGDGDVTVTMSLEFPE